MVELNDVKGVEFTGRYQLNTGRRVDETRHVRGGGPWRSMGPIYICTKELAIYTIGFQRHLECRF